MGERELIVLDTHAWIWHVTEDARLDRRARLRLRRAERLGVHPVSCWEVAMLVAGQRLRLSLEVTRWVELALGYPKVELLPFTASAAVRAAGLGGTFPGDPADRFIVAAALELGAPLMTRDTRISEWGQVPTVWH
jgi:PIN domain nuclease of toxin-antitoxin system